MSRPFVAPRVIQYAFELVIEFFHFGVANDRPLVHCNYQPIFLIKLVNRWIFEPVMQQSFTFLGLKVKFEYFIIFHKNSHVWCLHRVNINQFIVGAAIYGAVCQLESASPLNFGSIF